MALFLFCADAGVSVLFRPLLCNRTLWLGGSRMLLDARYNPDTCWRSSSGTENMLLTVDLVVIVGHLKRNTSALCVREGNSY